MLGEGPPGLQNALFLTRRFVLVLVVVLPTSPNFPVVERASLARPTSSGWQHIPWASSDRLSSNRPREVMECGSVGVLRQVRKAPA